MILRDYQQEIVNKLRDSIRAGNRVIMIQLPTGGGKTAIGSYLSKRFIHAGGRQQVFLHRDFLHQQWGRDLAKFGVQGAELISVWKRGDIDTGLVLDNRPTQRIFDEAHRIVAKSFRRHLEEFDGLAILLTATPIRYDGTGFDDLVDDLILGPSVRWMIENGHLCGYRLKRPKAVIDESKLEARIGEYTPSSSARAMAKITGDALEEFLTDECKWRKAISFLPTVKAAHDFAALFSENGIPSVAITRETPNREEIMAQFELGQIQHLASVEIFCEGYDVGNVSAIIDMAATQSVSRLMQKWGRGLRTAEGKIDCVILDHANNSRRLDLLPDDEIQWTLAGTKKGAVRKKDATPLHCCEVCQSLFRGEACPNCGVVVGSMQRDNITVAAGELEWVDRDSRAAEEAAKKARYQEELKRARAAGPKALQEFGRIHGHKTGWARRQAESLRYTTREAVDAKAPMIVALAGLNTWQRNGTVSDSLRGYVEADLQGTVDNLLRAVCSKAKTYDQFQEIFWGESFEQFIAALGIDHDAFDTPFYEEVMRKYGHGTTAQLIPTGTETAIPF